MTDVSIVIRCNSDPRVFRCLDSIDEDVEVILSISNDEEFEKALQERDIRYCISPRGNLSLTSNIGFENARCQKVIITDSDTVFEKGCIRIMSDALNEGMLVRASLRFDHSPVVLGSRMVADARDYVYSKELAFTPGLGVRKDILPLLGGFLFNDVVPFAVDADLDNRAKEAGLEVNILEDAVLVHHPESIRHDLKAARRIGSGVAVSSRSLAEHYGRPYDMRNIRSSLKAVHPSDYPSIFRSKGIMTMLYQLIWDANFKYGSLTAPPLNKQTGVFE